MNWRYWLGLLHKRIAKFHDRRAWIHAHKAKRLLGASIRVDDEQADWMKDGGN